MKSRYMLIASIITAGLALSASYASAGPIEASTQIKLAPNKGIIGDLNGHVVGAPSLFNLDSQPSEAMGPLLSRQYFHGNESTFVKWDAKEGAKVPLHKHPNEQITWLVSGEAIVYSGGKQYTMKAGDMMVFPANVPHEFHFTKDTIDIDFFAPARQDWIDGTANYIK